MTKQIEFGTNNGMNIILKVQNNLTLGTLKNYIKFRRNNALHFIRTKETFSLHLYVCMCIYILYIFFFFFFLPRKDVRVCSRFYASSSY